MNLKINIKNKLFRFRCMKIYITFFHKSGFGFSFNLIFYIWIGLKFNSVFNLDSYKNFQNYIHFYYK